MKFSNYFCLLQKVSPDSCICRYGQLVNLDIFEQFPISLLNIDHLKNLNRKILLIHINYNTIHQPCQCFEYLYTDICGYALLSFLISIYFIAILFENKLCSSFLKIIFFQIKFFLYNLDLLCVCAFLNYRFYHFNRNCLRIQTNSGFLQLFNFIRMHILFIFVQTTHRSCMLYMSTFLINFMKLIYSM